MTPVLLMRLRVWPVHVIERLTYRVEVGKWQVFKAMSWLTTPRLTHHIMIRKDVFSECRRPNVFTV